MDQERKQDIALMRYSAISPLLTGPPEDYPSQSAYFQEVSRRGITAPDGRTRHYAPKTICKWYNAYRHGGFDSLLPTGRSDLGRPRRIDDDLQEQIRHLKENYPRMTAAAIFRQLRDNGSIANGQVSEATVGRYVNLLALEMKSSPNQDMRRYERPHINEAWCGDSSVGPSLKAGDGKNTGFTSLH